MAGRPNPRVELVKYRGGVAGAKEPHTWYIDIICGRQVFQGPPDRPRKPTALARRIAKALGGLPICEREI